MGAGREKYVFEIYVHVSLCVCKIHMVEEGDWKQEGGANSILPELQPCPSSPLPQPLGTAQIEDLSSALLS